jgi:hypothetical protein
MTCICRSEQRLGRLTTSYAAPETGVESQCECADRAVGARRWVALSGPQGVVRLQGSPAPGDRVLRAFALGFTSAVESSVIAVESSAPAGIQSVQACSAYISLVALAFPVGARPGATYPHMLYPPGATQSACSAQAPRDAGHVLPVFAAAALSWPEAIAMAAVIVLSFGKLLNGLS